MEKWVDVNEFPAYEIHPEEGIRRKGGLKSLKGRNWLGYPKVTLMRDGQKHEKRIHKLVGEHFVDNPNNLPIVNHKDSNRSNHAVRNLEWVDNSGNQLHRWKTQKEGLAKKKYSKEYDNTMQKVAGSEGLKIYDTSSDYIKMLGRNSKAMGPDKKKKYLKKLDELSWDSSPIYGDEGHYEVDGKYFNSLHDGTYTGKVGAAARKYGKIVNDVYDPIHPIVLNKAKSRSLLKNKIAVMNEVNNNSDKYFDEYDRKSIYVKRGLANLGEEITELKKILSKNKRIAVEAR